jgi:curved DNA-binding protein CbpA
VNNDPWAVFGLPADADEQTIRRRYLELVRQYTPEHHPEKFAAIRAAYEHLQDRDGRLRHRLFQAGKDESMDAILEDLKCRSPRRRLSLRMLLTTLPQA